MIAEAEKKVVVAIMMSAEKFVCLYNEIFVMVPDFWRRFERGGAVGGNVHLGGRIVGEFDYFEKFAGDYRRINQSVQRRRLNEICVSPLSALVDAMGRAVPYFQLAGSLRLAT